VNQATHEHRIHPSMNQKRRRSSIIAVCFRFSKVLVNRPLNTLAGMQNMSACLYLRDVYVSGQNGERPSKNIPLSQKSDFKSTNKSLRKQSELALN
jgi:hypothetical protein